MSSALPKPEPNADSLTYWNAAGEQRLLLRECLTCGARHFMPRHACPKCWSDKLEWIESKGAGTVHSFSVVHRAPLPVFSVGAPYVVALIDLDEGPRMLANVVGDAALGVEIGDRVQVMFEERDQGSRVPQFTRVQGQ